MHLTMATKAITTVTILLSALQAIGWVHDSEWTSISHESRLTKTTFQTDSKLVGPSNLVEGGQENGIRQDSKRIIECPENCKCENTATYCVGHIPPEIPPQIQQVTVADLQCNYLKNQTPFTHTSWRQVRILRMFEVSYESCNGTFIENGFLRGLNKLHLLKIEFSNIYDISVNALSPLTELETLDVSDCKRLRLSVLNNALSMVSFAPKISTIIAERTGSYLSAVTEKELKDLSTVSATRNVSTVNLSSTEFEKVTFTDINGVCHSLKLLNVSHSRMLSTDDSGNSLLCDSLEILDISGINLPTKSIPEKLFFANKEVTLNIKFIPKWLLTLSTLYANDIFKLGLRLYNTTIKIDFEINDITVQNLSFNMLRVADVKFVYTYAQNNTEDFTFPFKMLDVSRSEIEYVSPGLFNNIKLLHQLDLSHNKLNMMERKTNFGKLFNNLANLHTVDLSYNNLSTLPPDIFLGAMRLHNVNLSNNRLKSLSLNTTQLMNLEYLDISQNGIASLDQSAISAIQEIVKYQQERRRFNKTAKIIEINMRKNPLICSCRALHFIRWFVQAPVFNRTPSYTCNLDNEQIPLDASAIPQVVYICDRPKRLRRNWILGSTTTVVAVFILTLAARFARLKWRARKRQDVIEDVIRRFRNGNLAQNFILFLSHSSRDDNLVDDHVYPELRDRLQRITNIQRDLICTGNRHILPGRALFAEMDRCLSNSSVFVPVVTLNYVRSRWCKEELEQARIKHMPMIIFFAEHVPPDEMPNILRDFFMRNVRVMTWLHNGDLNIQPSWKAVCDAIFYSVAETENNQWNIRNIIGCFTSLCCRIWCCVTCCNGDRELVEIDRQRLV